VMDLVDDMHAVADLRTVLEARRHTPSVNSKTKSVPEGVVNSRRTRGRDMDRQTSGSNKADVVVVIGSSIHLFSKSTRILQIDSTGGSICCIAMNYKAA
jgi:hypothetical protein